MCSFYTPIKSYGLWNKLQIFVHGIKRGLRRRQHVLNTNIGENVVEGILLIDAVLFPF